MADSQDFQLPRETVYGRDESAGGIFGFGWGDIGMMGAALFVPLFLGISLKVSLVFLVAIFFYVKKLKSFLPENIITNFFKFAFRRHKYYRASGRDTLWLPPVVKARAPLFTAKQDP